jgi:hypothetical protein
MSETGANSATPPASVVFSITKIAGIHATCPRADEFKTELPGGIRASAVAGDFALELEMRDALDQPITLRLEKIETVRELVRALSHLGVSLEYFLARANPPRPLAGAPRPRPTPPAADTPTTDSGPAVAGSAAPSASAIP